MWRHRNGIRHHPNSLANRRLAAELDDIIGQHFELGTDNLLPQHHHWIHDCPKAEILQYDIHLKRQWIASVEQHRRLFDRTQTRSRLAQQGQRLLMRRWLEGLNPFEPDT